MMMMLIFFPSVARCTVTGSGRPTCRRAWPSPGVRGPAGSCARASGCRSSPWRASRPATTWASSSTGPTPPTGCSSTAWPTGKVSHASSPPETVERERARCERPPPPPSRALLPPQVARTDSTSPAWRRVRRWAATSACRRTSWEELTPPPCVSRPGACCVTPTCVCTTAPSSACTSDTHTHTQ